jgi:hypothetical protein
MTNLFLFFSFAAGSVIGFFVHEFIGPVISHKLSQKRNIEAAQTADYIKEYGSFYAALIPARQSLESPNTSLKEIVITEFPKHKTARLSLLRVLKNDSKRLSRFNEKWTEYEKIANEYLNYNNNIPLQNAEYLLECAKDSKFIKGLPSDMQDKFAAEFLETEGIRKKYIHGLLESLCDITTKY